MINIRISKREELVFATLFLSALLFVTLLFPLGWPRFGAQLFLGIISYFVTLLILREDLQGLEKIILPCFPVLFTFTSAFFYAVLPERWLTRLTFIIAYGILIYSILLTENIFNVAKSRSIQLLRVARAIYYFTSSFSVFLFAYVLLSMRLPGIIGMVLCLAYGFLLVYAYVWSYGFKKYIGRDDVFGAFAIAILLGELYFCLSFWPVNIYLTSIFLASLYYSILGIWENLLNFKVRGWNLWEYLLINVVLFILMILTVNFG